MSQSTLKPNAAGPDLTVTAIRALEEKIDLLRVRWQQTQQHLQDARAQAQKALEKARS